MCGIVGYTGTREAAPILIDGLRRLEYRGYDSAGLAVSDGQKLSLLKCSGSVARLEEKLKLNPNLHGHCGIAHTRWATHGAPTDENAHPHLSADGRFAVIHNGIIENYLNLREELTAMGYDFKSETDTEVVAHLLELNYDGDFKTAVLRTAARLEGSYVLGFLCADLPDKIYVAKQAGPLLIGIGVGENYFASDVTALISHTKNVVYMEDGEFAEVSPKGVCYFDGAGKVLEKEVSRVVWDIEAAEKGGYEHFMLKEIGEQPRAVQATIEPRIKNGKIVFEDFNLDSETILNFDKIVITACGSAYHAGVVGKYMIESLCRVPVITDLASELRYRDPLIDEKTLVIVISQSGETADTIAALSECKSRGARVLAITNVVGSTISRMADHVIYTHAGPEIAVATTKGYTTQLAALCMFTLWLANKLGKVDEHNYATLLEGIKALPHDIQRAIDLSHNAESLAHKYHKHKSVFFMGRNLDYAVGLEGSLKLKEISYIHSEAYAAGELKHGTIALIDSDRLVVALCCQEFLLDKMISNIQEVKARGAKVLAIAAEGNRRIYTQADDILHVPCTVPLFSCAVQTVPLQLFSYYVAKYNGCDIDKPKNLAKSVTVE